MSDGNGGYARQLRKADADWTGDYEIMDRNDLVNGRVWIENRPTGDAVGAINKGLRAQGPGLAGEAGPTRGGGLGRRTLLADAGCGEDEGRSRDGEPWGASRADKLGVEAGSGREERRYWRARSD
jgi:hypothetical protein